VITTEDKYRLRRYRTAYGSTIFSITLVLFLLGLLLILTYQANVLSGYVRENIGLQIEISDQADSDDIAALSTAINNHDFTRRLVFISKEEAGQKLSDELGEDFLEFIGYNPLPNAFELFLKSEYAVPDSMTAIKETLHGYPAVSAIHYQESLLTMIHRNINRISTAILIFTGLLLLISVMLILNTIRLAVYAKRMILKSMLLVGATQSYIRRPFIINGLLQGAFSGAFAVLMLWVVLSLVLKQMPGQIVSTDHGFMWGVSAVVILFGLLVTWISNLIAIKKYLKIRSEDLY
jgi:cell division transport system permease protein